MDYCHRHCPTVDGEDFYFTHLIGDPLVCPGCGSSINESVPTNLEGQPILPRKESPQTPSLKETRR